MPDPRFNPGYQPQQQQQLVQQMPQQQQQQVMQQMTPQHQYQKPMYSYRPSWSDSHTNYNAAWIAIGPNVLYTLGIILMGILFAAMSNDGGDFEVLFAGFIGVLGLIIWLFSSLIVSILSTVAAFNKKCPKVWMIVGPGIGFVASLLTYILILAVIVDGVQIDDLMEDLFEDASGFEIMIIGFIIHTVMAFGTMMLMVLASNNEQY